MLTAIASWLESPNNEAILLSEYNEECLKIVASSCVQAAFSLHKAAEIVDQLEPPEKSHLTPESLQELKSIVDAFDSSNDPELQKQASVIDELLLSIAAPTDSIAKNKKRSEDRLENLKKMYSKNIELAKLERRSDYATEISKSPMMKEYRPMQHSLSERYCPDHVGVSVARIGDDEWQCPLDKKIYNYKTGFSTITGDQVPGTSVEEQTKIIYEQNESPFDTRESRMQNSK